MTINITNYLKKLMNKLRASYLLYNSINDSPYKYKYKQFRTLSLISISKFQIK